MKWPFNPLIVAGLFMVMLVGGTHLTAEKLFIVLAVLLVVMGVLPFISYYEKVWYVKHGRPKMTWLIMVIINVSEWAAAAYGLILGYALGAA